MGLGKLASNIGKGIGRIAKPVLKPVTRPAGRAARTAYSTVAAPVFGGLFLQPEQMGIKSKKNQARFTRSQRAGRIAVGVGAAAFGGAGLAGVGPLAGALSGTGTALAGMLPSLSTVGSVLGKGALATLRGGLFGGGGGFGGGGTGPGGYGGGGGLSDEARRLMGRQEALIGRQEELAGASPEAEDAYRRRATQSLRAGQAERGIFESGVAAAQEAELSPMIEEQIRRARLGELEGISRQYEPLYGAAARAGEEPGSPWAGLGGQFAGNIGYNLLEKYFGDEE